jgi:hypothetical protein
LTFFSSIPVAGFAIRLSLTHATCWPLWVAAAAVIGIVVVTAFGETTWPARVVKAIATDCIYALANARSRTAAVGLLSVVTIAGTLLHVEAAQTSEGVARDRDLFRWYTNQTSLVSRGSDVPAMVTVFTDYQCPACRDAVPSSAKVAEQYRANGLHVELTTRDFPLDATCNAGPGVPNLHPAACVAAAAVRLVRIAKGEAAAAELGRWLYGHGALTVNQVRDQLHALGLLERFDQEVSTLLDGVRTDASMGRNFGVRATPTFFVNGVRIPNGPGVLARILDYESRRRANIR